MITETQLYARAILLEEYRNGTTVEKAMEKVHAELGPNAISRENINHWFKAFKCGCEKIAHTADGADRCLIENGTFLRSKRSLLSGLHGTLSCHTYGTNSRLQFVCHFHNLTHWMVDTFNRTTKEIYLDLPDSEEPNKPHFALEIMYFLNGSEVCGVFSCRFEQTRFWFQGNFNDASVVLRIDSFKHLNNYEYTLNTQTQPPTLTAFSDTHFYSYTVDLANGNLSEANTTDMHYNLSSPKFLNGKLFGFPVDPDIGVNVNKMLEVSLVDGSKIEHDIKGKSDMEIAYSYSTVWINDQLLVGTFDYNNEISRIFKFDISQMKWENTKIEVEGVIDSVNIVNGLLIVHAVSWKDDSDHLYRFQYEAVDSLANLVWLSMQRYSLRNPSFHEWFMSKLPKNHRFRSLWN